MGAVHREERRVLPKRALTGRWTPPARHGGGPEYNLAANWRHRGSSASPQVGAIAVMGRRGGGHVGIITGIDASGNPIMISGNNGNRVKEAPISRGRIYAYVVPTN